MLLIIQLKNVCVIPFTFMNINDWHMQNNITCFVWLWNMCLIMGEECKLQMFEKQSAWENIQT
jgi:hypothetical protein